MFMKYYYIVKDWFEALPFRKQRAVVVAGVILGFALVIKALDLLS
jgi:hypothetical protein